MPYRYNLSKTGLHHNKFIRWEMAMANHLHRHL
jgi:hypothetical protein